MKLTRYITLIITALCLFSGQAKAQRHKPWVTKTTTASTPTLGLSGNHICIWPSHGRYYNFKKASWVWQRPQIFCTTEDLFTQTIVIPYLVPMLENAGCNVLVARERDWQTEESIVDNDLANSGYSEKQGVEIWEKAPRPGFAINKGVYHDGDRPFAAGTARMIKSTPGQEVSKAFYKPSLKKSGKYAVYVSYQTVDGSVDDAEYIVVHQGVQTKFRVNQQMGSGTWVYLGAFDFDSNNTNDNYVAITNNSSRRTGYVTTDAVRFGGGIGNHEREGKTSNLPRAMECSRYWSQFAGAPRAAICTKGGHDDYGDDINSRSLTSNWLSYGSTTNPTEKPGKYDIAEMDTATLSEAAVKEYLDSIARLNIQLDSAGQAAVDSTAKAIADSILHVPVSQINVMSGPSMSGKVPLELQLAIHSDAGYHKDFSSVFGTLTICTTDFNDEKLASGNTRRTSFYLATDLLNNINDDIKKYASNWEVRDTWDRNYSETRLPAQPSAIIETMSHESFPDMKLGHDPNFKFVLARSIYKTIARYLAIRNGHKAVITPLTPQKFQITQVKDNVLKLKWEPNNDPNEISATTESYNVYTRIGNRGYDNGNNIKSSEYTVILQPDTLYRFRITGVNAGGESFPSEELVAMYNPKAKKTVMIVNAFHRLSSPAVVDTDSRCGFDLDDDIGLSYGKTPAWVGHQVCFDKSLAGQNEGLGYSNSDLIGRFTAGNDFNYAFSHAEAISQCGDYNILSMSSDAIEDSTAFNKMDMVDILLGNEKDDGHSLLHYKSFTPVLQKTLTTYENNGGSVFANGSYIASDMQKPEEAEWLANTLHIAYGGADRDTQPFRTDSITDMIHCDNLGFSAYRHVNEDHYASVASDIIIPSDTTLLQTIKTMMEYADGNAAAMNYSDDKVRTVAMGFPFDCIKEQADRKALMKKILEFILPKETK